jgi:TonB-dependent receptor
LRLAASQTRTRPSFSQLNPGVVIEPLRNCGGGSPCHPGTRGDPFLKSQDSNNYDASLEYYFSRTGFAALAVFRRDLRGFIVNSTERLPDPDPVTGFPLLITGPVNLSKGRVQGFEAQFSTFFDYDFMPDWAKGFGVQANVTHLDTEADYQIFPEFFPPVTPGGPEVPNPNYAEVTLRLPDVSKWTYNLVGMYEGGGLTLRLAYNRRSNFPEAALAERDFFFTLQGRGRAVSRLDWSSSYAFNDNFTFFFDWTNILAKPFKSDIVRVNYPGGNPSDPEIFPMVVRFEESVFSGGVRFRF